MSRRYWQWARPFGWEPERTALLIIDMQRGFIREDSPLVVPMARDQVGVIAATQQAFRERGLPVVQTRFVVRDDAYYPFYRTIAPQRGIDSDGTTSPFAPDGDDAAIIDELAPRPDESVVDKVGYDGFGESSLEDVLRGLDVDTLVVAGTVVNWCVDSTIRSAFHRRFNLIVVADGVSGYDHGGISARTWVDAELDLFAEAFAVVMGSDDLIASLDHPELRAAGIRGHAPVGED